VLGVSLAFDPLLFAFDVSNTSPPSLVFKDYVDLKPRDTSYRLAWVDKLVKPTQKFLGIGVHVLTGEAVYWDWTEIGFGDFFSGDSFNVLLVRRLTSPRADRMFSNLDQGSVNMVAEHMDVSYLLLKGPPQLI
jgi:hypothetical protein